MKHVIGIFCLPRFEIRASFPLVAKHGGMNNGKSIFSQLIGFLPDREFRRCVARYEGTGTPEAFLLGAVPRSTGLPGEPPRY
jgi:hypothetical protein